MANKDRESHKSQDSQIECPTQTPTPLKSHNFQDTTSDDQESSEQRGYILNHEWRSQKRRIIKSYQLKGETRKKKSDTTS